MDLPARIEAWDLALGAVRACLRARGLREVTTPVRLPAVAIEPYVEPVRAEGGLLATSPELPMKQLVAGGSGPIFQVAHVLRAAEVGAHHAEEFHLIEWYRPDATELEVLCRDVEAIVSAVHGAVARANGPQSWQTHGMLDLIARTSGVCLRGDEDSAGLAAALARANVTAYTTDDVLAAANESPTSPTSTNAVRGDVDAVTVAAWTTFFTSWSDAYLDPWLATQTDGVHVVEFPIALAALASLGDPKTTQAATGPIAQRVESYVAGVELSNGYCELTDATIQQQRFDAVQNMRDALGQPRLPNPDAFVTAMRAPGLPPTVGCALGLDRLLAVACGVQTLAEVALPLPWSRVPPDAD